MSAAAPPPDAAPAAASRVLVVGGGPAGLMAAETLLAGGVAVELFDAMPSVGRKFLRAGIGGLNLTHGEPLARFVRRYGSAGPRVARWLEGMGPQAVRDWAAALGIETFVGSSGRVFPRDMKAAPLLRAWLERLRAAGLRLHARHRWTGDLVPGPGGRGWTIGLQAPAGPLDAHGDAVVLALGGGSWRRLGSDGAWLPWLADRGVAVAPLRPANCGFDVAGWSAHLRERHAGAPLKTVALALPAEDDAVVRARDGNGPDDEATVRSGTRAASEAALRWTRGECVLTATGIEGSLVYAHAAALRDRIAREGRAMVWLDLLPDLPAERVRAELRHPRGSRSWASHLKSRLGVHGVKAALLREVLGAPGWTDPDAAARALKSLPLTLVAARPIDEAISTAGGVRLEAVDDALMLQALPGVFVAGEMLDWEAPTGGYLLTACLASSRVAGQGVLRRLAGAGPSAAG